MMELVKRPGNSPTADQLANDRDRAIELAHIMSGQFDDRIAELKKLNEEFEKRQGIVKTMEKAERLVNDAISAASETVANAAKRVAEAEVQREEVMAEIDDMKNAASIAVDAAHTEAREIIAAANSRRDEIEADTAVAIARLQDINEEAHVASELASAAEQSLKSFEAALAEAKAKAAKALGL